MSKSKMLIVALAAVFVCTAAIFAALTAFIATPGLAGQKNGLLHALEAIGFAPVEQTGQTMSYEDDDDGDLQMGISWPTPRFTDNDDGTVTDNLTGLIWLKDANRFDGRNWAEALSDCNNLEDDGSDLTDGSSAGDWHLPNVKELQSLIDYGQFNPALPPGYDSFFTSVLSYFYWSSTTYANPNYAWTMNIVNGYMDAVNKGTFYYSVWPVRGGCN